MLTEMFCLIDDFCKSMEESAEGRKLLGEDSDLVRRRENLSLSERITIEDSFAAHRAHGQTQRKITRYSLR